MATHSISIDDLPTIAENALDCDCTASRNDLCFYRVADVFFCENHDEHMAWVWTIPPHCERFEWREVDWDKFREFLWRAEQRAVAAKKG